MLLLPSAVTAENSPVAAEVEMQQELTQVARSEPQLGVWPQRGHPKSTGQPPWDKPNPASSYQSQEKPHAHVLCFRWT